MATRDLRFFDSPGAEALPDGYPRRGMSVVAALSQWLLHTNRRRSGSWTQRYERGGPVTDLTPIPDDGATRTTVHFQPDASLDRDPRRLMNLSTATPWTHLRVDVADERQD